MLSLIHILIIPLARAAACVYNLHRVRQTVVVVCEKYYLLKRIAVVIPCADNGCPVKVIFPADRSACRRNSNGFPVNASPLSAWETMLETAPPTAPTSAPTATCQNSPSLSFLLIEMCIRDRYRCDIQIRLISNSNLLSSTLLTNPKCHLQTSL